MMVNVVAERHRARPPRSPASPWPARPARPSTAARHGAARLVRLRSRRPVRATPHDRGGGYRLGRRQPRERGDGRSDRRPDRQAGHRGVPDDEEGAGLSESVSGWSLPRRGAHRIRRHGRGLPRRRHGPRPHGRDQDPAPAVRPGRQLRRAVPPRGAGGRPAEPPQHRRHLRHRLRRRDAVHRDGVHRGPNARRLHGRGRRFTPIHAVEVAEKRLRGARRRARRRRDPPRHQARQHHGHAHGRR